MATTRGTANAPQAAEEIGDEMSAQFERVDSELRAFVKERPVMALLSAVAAGYVLGRMLRRHA